MAPVEPESRGKEASGKLTPKALKKALFLVETNRYVGNIHVSRGEEEKHIYFTVGGIRLLTAGTRRKTPLGKLLVRYGKLTPALMREALQTQKRTGRRIGDVLTNVMKVLQGSDIDEVVRIQVENEIYDVITWEDGVYEYTPAMPDALFNKKLKATTLSTDIPDLIERSSLRAISSVDRSSPYSSERAVPTARPSWVPEPKPECSRMSETSSSSAPPSTPGTSSIVLAKSLILSARGPSTLISVSALALSTMFGRSMATPTLPWILPRSPRRSIMLKWSLEGVFTVTSMPPPSIRRSSSPAPR